MLKIGLFHHHSDSIESLSACFEETFSGVHLDYQVKKFKTIHSLLKHQHQYHLILMSLDFKKVDVLEASKQISNHIIFISSDPNKVFKAFGTNVVGFVLEAEILSQLSPLLFKWLNQEFLHEEYRFISLGKQTMTNIKYADIQMIFLRERKVYALTRCQEEILTSYKTLSECVRNHKHPHFYRPNNYTYINLSWIERIEKNQIYLTGSDLVIDISRNRAPGFKQAFARYLNVNLD